MTEHSSLLSRTLGITFPFIILFSIYMILNGHITPGGGFQGGAVMASIFIAKYLIVPVKDIRLVGVQFVEKIALLLILLFATAFVISGLNIIFPSFSQVYMVVMNVLIGLKVACGMTIIFYRFVYYESR
ncbi:MnhB domain-containing protein [Fusibacter tunisiensis]|uniref:Multicomponent Na+:H+ antiporter subunit B n=1 Tax=Fusibacter tunisiensis TaxID=1008308 RepID=A0ABS2MS51_9FIRM|nr:MnhB domain-containing protein [Fusibacter tunisiensis]MBM7562214.1 multicomponent Na+:H+ antiporter subunit B [Fusibacter tunisiensis]